MHSVLQWPITLSINLLSSASPTVPIEGAMPSMAMCSVKRIIVYCEPACEWLISPPRRTG
jgi:hypothetical protein